jgi:hypothetical protein
MKKRKVIVRKEHINAYRGKHICKRCHAAFNTSEELINHKEIDHGEFVRSKHSKVKNSKDHQIYLHYNDKPKSTVDKFNPKELYDWYLNNCTISGPVDEPNDVDIPEEERIYSEGKTYWCTKTTKKQATAFTKSLNSLHKNMKSRGTTAISPEVNDMVMAGKMHLIHIDEDRIRHGSRRNIDILHMFDKYSKNYRIYTTECKYKEFMEVVFNNVKGCFEIKDVAKSRPNTNKNVARSLEDIGGII